MAMQKSHSRLVSSKNIIQRSEYLDNLYKNIFNVNVSNQDVKSMKRFMRRKFENDNLNKKVRVNKKHWNKLMRISTRSSIKLQRYLENISTLVGEPRLISSPISGGIITKTRAYVNRPISARRNKEKLKINKIRYNTEIVIIEEYIAKTIDSDDFSNDESFDEESDKKFTLYIESQVDSLSDVHSQTKNKIKEGRSVLLQVPEPEVNQLKHLKTFIRKKTIVQPTALNVDDIDSDDDEELILNGDYVLRSALLKDYDIQELSTKEMQHCLSKLCKVHIGQNDIGNKIKSVYRKPEIKEISEQEVNTIVIQFLREIRRQNDPKTVLDLLDDIQLQFEKISPYGSMMRIFYKLEDDLNSHRDVWFTPNREDTY